MFPDTLKPGDTIGVFSPSSPGTVFGSFRYERAKKYLSGKGFRIIDGSLTGKNDFYRSGSIRERADELNNLIRNPGVKCIISSIGGMNSNSLLPYIDYEQLIKTPKIIIGYSDVTAILFAVYAKTGIHTFYGPAMVPSFGEQNPFLDLTYEYFRQILVDEIKFPHVFPTPNIWTDEFVPFGKDEKTKIEKPNKLVTLNSGIAEGRFIGGNLNTLGGIWGSIYMPEIAEGDILLIEDSEKDIADVERSFSHLKINGVFDKIGGLIIGKPESFDDKKSGRKYYEVLLEVMGKSKIPILADFDCSHTKPMLTMPIGCNMRLDAGNQQVSLTAY